MRAIIDQTYDEDGKSFPSAFMLEIGLTKYEPGCIEAISSKSGLPVPVKELLKRSSYSDQWLPYIDKELLADAAICVFAPNEVAKPNGSSLEYAGSFNYAVP